MLFVDNSFADSHCVWATGKLICEKDQSLVINATVTLFDRDGGLGVLGQIDPDDKMGFTHVAAIDGLFSVEGCASDSDIVPGLFSNIPEPYISVHHQCNRAEGEDLVLASFKVFVPNTYDHYMKHPIVLDDSGH